MECRTGAAPEGPAPETIYQAACTCAAERGWAVTPVKGKKPFREGWQATRIDPAARPELFAGATGFGVVLGLSGLVDLEADCLAAERALEVLAPETAAIWEHGGRKHRLYRSEAAYREWAFGGSTLAEVRAGPHQSVAPPSVHPGTGQRYAWVRDGDPAAVEADALYRAGSLAAMAGACARCWPAQAGRGRHHAALALAGVLRRAGVTRDEALAVMQATCHAAGDEERTDRQRAVSDTYDQAPGARLTGLRTLRQILGSELANWLRDRLPDAQEDAGDNPSTSSIWFPRAASEYPAPLAEEAFLGFAGRVVRVVEPHTEADPAALLINTLIWAGNLIGPSVYAKVGPDTHRLKENAVLVGPTSSGRKGTSAGPSRELFGFVDPAWVGGILHGLSTGEGLIWAIRDPILKRIPVKEKGRIVGYEEQIEDAGVEDKRLLVLEGEFANLLKVMVREGNTLSVQVRLAWDLDVIRSVTKNNPATATGAHVSLIGHITPEELRRHLTETEAASGFGNRFLWVCVRRSKLLPHGGGAMPLTALAVELEEIVERARRLGELRRDAAADRVWEAVYPDLVADRPGMFGALTSRAAAHTLRLSAIYAALDGSPFIRVPHLLAALAVWSYCDASARYLFGDATSDSVADQILAALRRKPDGMTRTEISQRFHLNLASRRIDQALNVLLQSGRARMERQPTEGRPREVWFAQEEGGTPGGSLLAKARAAAEPACEARAGDEVDEQDTTRSAAEGANEAQAGDEIDEDDAVWSAAEGENEATDSGEADEESGMDMETDEMEEDEWSC